MSDPQQFRDWVVAAAVLIALPLASRPFVRRVLGPPLLRLGRRAWARLNPEPEPDPEADALWRAIRRAELLPHLERLRILVATDEWMSATRQIGNRLAYEQLRRDCAGGVDLDGWSNDLPSAAGWNRSTPVRTGRPAAAQIEILDIGWRR